MTVESIIDIALDEKLTGMSSKAYSVLSIIEMPDYYAVDFFITKAPKACVGMIAEINKLSGKVITYPELMNRDLRNVPESAYIYVNPDRKHLIEEFEKRNSKKRE